MSSPRLKMELGTRDEDVRDDSSRGGILHRARHLSGWVKHLHGYACPRCGATCHDRGQRDRHDSDHRQRDEWDEEWQELVEALEVRIVKLEGQVELMTELLGPALDRVLQEREPA